MTSEPRSILDEILHLIGQEHLMVHAQEEREILSLKKEVQALDVQFLFELQKQIHEASEKRFTYQTPPLTPPEEATCDLTEFGCIILAGGQASRLRIDGPKGCVPITPFSQKSLFELHAEKIRAISEQIAHPFPVAIMTSLSNRGETELFFQQHGYFGLNPAQVSFFSQRSWPLLNFDGNLLLRAPGKLAMGPNGNGDVFHQFVTSGIWERWNERGVKHVRTLAVDNPLALPVDRKLFMTHLAHKNAITIQGVKKEKGEKSGTLSLIDGKIGVLEYGEFEGEGEYANIGLYVFSMPFIKRASEADLPLHKVKKAIKTIETETPIEPNAWKFETFIFDAFPLSNKSELLLYPRKNCFAPLKNFEGEGSMATVQEAVASNERDMWATLIGTPLPEKAQFELGSAFYYPTQEQLERWKGKPFPNQKVIEDL